MSCSFEWEIRTIVHIENFAVNFYLQGLQIRDVDASMIQNPLGLRAGYLRRGLDADSASIFSLWKNPTREFTLKVFV